MGILESLERAAAEHGGSPEAWAKEPLSTWAAESLERFRGVRRESESGWARVEAIRQRAADLDVQEFEIGPMLGFTRGYFSNFVRRRHIPEDVAGRIEEKLAGKERDLSRG